MKKLDDYFNMNALEEYYGVTEDLNNCGYILPNGKMLKYMDANHKVKEHFEVEKFYKKNKCDCKIDENHKPICEGVPKCRYSIRKIFMHCGAVRCIPGNIPIINISSSYISKKTSIEFIENCIFNLKTTLVLEVNKRTMIEYIDEIIMKDIKSYNISIDIDSYDSNIMYKIERLLNA